MIPLVLAASIYEQIQREGASAYPNECCGAMLGRDVTGDAGTYRVVERLEPLPNSFQSDEQFHRFSLNARDMMRVEQTAAENGQLVLGFYHSHPDHPARPSEYDRTHGWPFYSYVIVAIEKRTPVEMTSWVLDEATEQFVAQAIVQSPPASSVKATNVTWHQGLVNRSQRQQLLNQKGVTIWLTGLSASGKSTIAVILERLLLERQKHGYRLDGDNIRHGLNSNLGFSEEERRENIRRIGEVAKLFTDAGVIVITSFISPYAADRAAVRGNMAVGDFVEVYVKVSLETAQKRDPKGLYQKARQGLIKDFTGIDAPYEAPESAEIVIDTETTAPDDAAQRILAYLEQRGYLQA